MSKKLAVAVLGMSVVVAGGSVEKDASKFAARAHAFGRDDGTGR
jgi:hypothetical protein